MITRQDRANAIRALSMDAIQLAKSGHPGMPLGMADIAEVLWHDFLKHNPGNPNWANRDRFILSNGHGSMLQYALLYLTGYELSLEDLKQFRQLNSKTPGHPEYGITPGVEVTTGPLGQGLACAVGMALGERLLADTFNQTSCHIINHYTYCFVGDGCLMEGISHEVCAIAGTLKLGKLIIFWDDNNISIDGKVNTWFSENVPKRFSAYDWDVIADVDGHDSESIKRAILKAQSVTDKPTLICCQTVIGFGSPNLSGKAKCHGMPMGEVEIALTRKQLGWYEPPFCVPKSVAEKWDSRKKGQQCEYAWTKTFEVYTRNYPDLSNEFKRRCAGELPNIWADAIKTFVEKIQTSHCVLATRKASQQTLDMLCKCLPELLGGSADLSGSNLTMHQAVAPITSKAIVGNYMHYGVREFGMAAIMNGLALYRGFIPYGGTFLVFADYARSAIRMSALMKQRVIYVLTHDSIAIGEDGPTHQPIEHLTMLRSTPNVFVWRPADAVETVISWQMAIERQDGPTVLALTRQEVKPQIRTKAQLDLIKLGGYVLTDYDLVPEVIFIATGSEVELAMKAAVLFTEKGHIVRVVSMPSVEVFLQQSIEYRGSVLLPDIPKVAIEAGATTTWYRFVGTQGKVIGLDHFGKSAPGNVLYQQFDITVDAIIQAAQEVLTYN